MAATKSKKTKKSNNKLSRSLPILLPALGAAVLLGVILILGNFIAAQPEETEPAADVLEANPYTDGDFEYDENGLLRCTADGAKLGIDVSEHQTEVDWEQVKAAGIDFVMIRAGYRGYTEGRMFLDSCFDSHLAGARAAGLEVGVYFFSQAVTPSEARVEAAFLLSLLGGDVPEMGVAYDWEFVSEDARTGAIDGRTMTDCALAFCNVIDKNGITPLVYFNQYQAENEFILEELAGFDFWLAMYTEEMTFPHRVDMWQYTEDGTIPGIEGTVDINIWMP